MYDWDDLRHFLAAARGGSFLSGARTLGVDQTTTARRVEALEEELGGALVTRHTTGISLTPLGEELLPLAINVEQEMYRVAGVARGHDQLLRGEVRLSSADGFMNDYLVPHLRSFQKAHPGIVLEISTGFEHSDLFRRQADVALRLGARPKQKSLVTKRLGSVGWGLYASRDYVASKWCKSQPDLADLGEHTSVVLDADRPRLPPMEWGDRVLQPAQVALSATSIPSQVSACRAGFGIALLPHLMARPHIDLIPLPDPEPAPASPIWLVVTKDSLRQTRVRTVVDFVQDRIKRDAVELATPPVREPGGRSEPDTSEHASQN